MLKKGRVNRVEDVVEPGKEVNVWVHRVDINAERLELTMIRPVDLKWKDIKPGMHLKGTVVRLENFGAFVEVGAERPGLVHVSEMSTDYVKSPSDVVSVGDEVEVAVLDVDRKKRQIRLSMKAMDEQEMVEEDPEPEIPQATAMEVALRRALEQSENGESHASDSPAESKRSRETQDDILRRTLQQRLKTGSGKE
jgi:ribosomal protein S1